MTTKDAAVRFPARLVRREALIFLGCFVGAYALNVGAILYYETRWIELVTQLGWVFIIAVTLYALAAIPRLIALAVRRAMR